MGATLQITNQTVTVVVTYTSGKRTETSHGFTRTGTTYQFTTPQGEKMTFDVAGGKCVRELMGWMEKRLGMATNSKIEVLKIREEIAE